MEKNKTKKRFLALVSIVVLVDFSATVFSMKSTKRPAVKSILNQKPGPRKRQKSELPKVLSNLKDLSVEDGSENDYFVSVKKNMSSSFDLVDLAKIYPKLDVFLSSESDQDELPVYSTHQAQPHVLTSDDYKAFEVFMRENGL